MAFVFEKVAEADWELYNSFNLSFDDKKLTATKYKWWTVDRDREIYLILLGGGAFESPEVYTLIWNNNKIQISVDKMCVTSNLSKNVIHCRIESIIAPITLKKDCNKLIEILNDAFASTISCDYVIDFLAEPKFVI